MNAMHARPHHVRVALCLAATAASCADDHTGDPSLVVAGDVVADHGDLQPSETWFAFECAPQQLDQVTGGAEIRMAFNNTASLGRDGDGTSHLVWVRDDKLWHGRRTASGTRWAIAEIPTTGAVIKPAWALVRDDDMVVAWDEKDAGIHRIMARHSTDGGVSWSHKPAEVVSVSGEDDVGSLGLYAVDDGDGARVAIVWNHKQGATKSVEVGVAGGQFDSHWPWTFARTTLAADGGDPSIDGAGDLLVVGYEYPDKRLGLRRSRDRGTTWEQEIPLQASPPGLAGMGGGDVGVAVRKTGSDRYDVYVAYQTSIAKPVVLGRSHDGGLTFDTAESVLLDHGLFAQIDINDQGDVVVGWERTDGNLSNDALKQFGLALSDDDWGEHQRQPDAHPNWSSFGTTYVQVALAEDGSVDTAWVARTTVDGVDTRTLFHQRGKLAWASARGCEP